MNKIFALLVVAILLVCTTSATLNSVLKDRIASFNKGNLGADSWKDLFDSFLDGADVDKLVTNSTTCVHNTEHGYDDISEAIGHFIQRGWSWENYLDLNGALGNLTPIIRVCYNVTTDSYEDINDHFSKFTSFVDFVMQAKDNAFIHIFDWYDVYAKINDAISRGRNKDLAFQVGRSLNLFLNFKPRGHAYLMHPDVGELPDLRPLEDWLKGFLNGTQILSSDKIKRCVNETDFMVTSIEDANRQFGLHTEDSFREGVFEIADMFAHLKPLNEQCYGGITDVESIIQKYIKSFTSPIDILINAARHFNEIYSDALGAIQHYNHSEWKECGKDCGDVFYNVFVTH
jgi:hypothetical protein